MEHKIALRELCFIISFLHVAGLGSWVDDPVDALCDELKTRSIPAILATECSLRNVVCFEDGKLLLSTWGQTYAYVLAISLGEEGEQFLRGHGLKGLKKSTSSKETTR